jgi:hypothetical protein
MGSNVETKIAFPDNRPVKSFHGRHVAGFAVIDGQGAEKAEQFSPVHLSSF